jgi:hypothetical protein
VSLLTDTFVALRQVVLLDDRVSRLEKTVDRHTADLEHHELRLRQIETLIFGPISPDQLRIKRP